MLEIEVVEIYDLSKYKYDGILCQGSFLINEARREVFAIGDQSRRTKRYSSFPLLDRKQYFDRIIRS